MSKKPVVNRGTRRRVSAESERLLALMAARSGISTEAVLETAIREKAEREQIVPPDNVITKEPPNAPSKEWQERFSSLVEEMRSGLPEEMSPEELEREIAQACEEVREARSASCRPSSNGASPASPS